MATGVSTRYRRLDVLPYAAAYADGNGDVLVANDAFHDLWQFCGAGSGPVGGQPLFELIATDDRQSVRDIVVAPRALPRSLSRVTRLGASVAVMIAEFVPIRRKSASGTVWLVVLGSADNTCLVRRWPGGHSNGSARAAGRRV